MPFLWVDSCCVLEKDLTLQRNVFVCWSSCLTQYFFGAVFVSLCFWVNRCYVLWERPHTDTELCLFVLFCTMFVWCRVCSAMFDSLCLWVNGCHVLRERPYSAAKYVCLLKLFLVPCLFDAFLFWRHAA